MFTKEMFNKWIRLSYGKYNHYEGWELMWKESPVKLTTVEEDIKILNKAMIETYPFLLPRNRWTGQVAENYDYDYNEWEAIPLGWQYAFGWELLNDLAEVVKKNNLTNFQIEQIKEKFGELRIYTNGDDEVYTIIDKYTLKSQITCIICGEPAKYISKGWICPYCEKHVPAKEQATKIEN